MNKGNISVKVELTSEDIYNFQKSYIFRTILPIGSTIFSIFIIMCAALVLLNDTNNSINPIRIIMVFAIPIIIFTVIFISLKRHSRMELDNNKLLQKAQNYVISDEEIEISSDSSKVSIRWNELYKAIEVKNGFQFFISRRQAYFIPKRYFNENLEQIELLRSFMGNAPIPKEEKKRKSIIKRIVCGVLIYILIFIVIVIVVSTL